MPFSAQLGTADSSLGNVVLGFGASSAPIYTADVDVSVGTPAMTSALTFVAPVYTAAITLTVGGPTMVSALTFTAPVYAAVVELIVAGPTMEASALALFNAVLVVAVADSLYSGGH